MYATSESKLNAVHGIADDKNKVFAKLHYVLFRDDIQQSAWIVEVQSEQIKEVQQVVHKWIHMWSK